MKRLLTAFALLAMTATVSPAAGSFLAVQLTSGTADIASIQQTGTTDYTSAYSHSDWGVKAEFWNMMADDYAVTFSAGIGLFSEVNQPGTSAPAGSGDIKYTQSAWNVRLGGDRVVALGERSYLFFGPGIEFWSGKAKFEDETPPATSYESETTTRISLSGRLGAHMMIGESWGLTLQGGHKVGYASSEELGGKATWWPSSMDASGGLIFRFGSN